MEFPASKLGDQHQVYKADHFGCLTNFLRFGAKFSMNLFFGEIDVVGIENIPRNGPVILVGNHKNQFVDGMMVVSIVRRKVAFLTAEKSMHLPIIGCLSKALDAIPVVRPQDRARISPGLLLQYDVEKHCFTGSADCVFNTNVKKGEMIVLRGMKEVPPLVIEEVLSDTELRVRPPRSNEDDPHSPIVSFILLTQGVAFKVIPKINQSEMFNKVHDALYEGKCIGIFPEGGSSDKTDLLPFENRCGNNGTGSCGSRRPCPVGTFWNQL